MSRKAESKSEKRLPKTAKPTEDEESDLELRRDWIALRYLHAAKLRRKRKPDEGERAFLKEFDAMRASVLRNPKAAGRRGMDAIHQGMLLLQTLIQERSMEGTAASEDVALYNAEIMLSFAAHGINEVIQRYAAEGCDWACHAVFRDGKALASTFSRLAIAYPEQFRKYTERALTMPSLRARNSAFSCDADAIIQAVHLGEKNHASNLHDNRTRIGALCHQFIAEWVDLLEAARLESTQRETPKDRWTKLPELRGNARTWWKLEVKERVHLEFERMRRNPLRNPGLWQELEKATDGGTDSAKRAALEKYCYNKLEQIAGPRS